MQASRNFLFRPGLSFCLALSLLSISIAPSALSGEESGASKQTLPGKSELSRQASPKIEKTKNSLASEIGSSTERKDANEALKAVDETELEAKALNGKSSTTDGEKQSKED
ncbi:MAG: hypothetical protein K2X27_21230, partial [Candidatus Obscuribacterales bacterium]|nr:hypothetical protein [Candidatus Obscuribacterales bacterium]